mmetsp:Transcript_14666/g.42202  ORF Transcript_14666/g.42202 Transcript_14666/m.42202 type:complete len:345 (-) Transcript_14666:2685-3719(-)
MGRTRCWGRGAWSVPRRGRGPGRRGDRAAVVVVSAYFYYYSWLRMRKHSRSDGTDFEITIRLEEITRHKKQWQYASLLLADVQSITSLQLVDWMEAQADRIMTHEGHWTSRLSSANMRQQVKNNDDHDEAGSTNDPGGGGGGTPADRCPSLCGGFQHRKSHCWYSQCICRIFSDDQPFGRLQLQFQPESERYVCQVAKYTRGCRRNGGAAATCSASGTSDIHPPQRCSCRSGHDGRGRAGRLPPGVVCRRGRAGIHRRWQRRHGHVPVAAADRFGFLPVVQFGLPVGDWRQDIFCGRVAGCQAFTICVVCGQFGCAGGNDRPGRSYWSNLPRGTKWLNAGIAPR